MRKLTKESTPQNCTTLASVSPPVDNQTIVSSAVIWNLNYTCFSFTRHVGSRDASWCASFWERLPDRALGRVWFLLHFGAKGRGSEREVHHCPSRSASVLCSVIKIVNTRRHGNILSKISSGSIGGRIFDPMVNSSTYMDRCHWFTQEGSKWIQIGGPGECTFWEHTNHFSIVDRINPIRSKESAKVGKFDYKRHWGN